MLAIHELLNDGHIWFSLFSHNEIQTLAFLYKFQN